MLVTITALLLQTTAAATPVEQVVVFSDRAEVTRKANAACAGKSQRVTFSGLPTTMDVRTLRAEAAGRASVDGVTSRVVQLEESVDERRAKLEAERDRLYDERGALEDQLAEIGERAAASQGYGGYFKGLLQEDLRNPKPQLARWKSTLDLLAKEDLEARRRRVDVTQQIRTLDRRRDQVQRQLSTLSSSPTREALEVDVAVRCAGANQATVRLSYVLPGATWHPEYDVRFDANGNSGVGKGTVELTVSAIVQQATGEDWEGVQLVLSTAKPKLGAEAPRPAPLWISGYDAGDEKVMVQGAERRERLQASSGAGNTGPRAAELDDGGKSFTLKLPHRVTVRADGRPYWMPVDRIRAKAEAKRVAIPKVSPYVYRTVKFENPAAYPLMAGNLHSFRGEAFMGTTALEYRAPGAPMEVSLGIDGELDVEREVMHQQDREPKLFDGKRRFERHYRVRVHNQGRARAVVEVRENIPVSKDESIAVELDRGKTTRGVMLDELRGFVSFDVKVAPGKDDAVDLAYTISLPKDWKVR